MHRMPHAVIVQIGKIVQRVALKVTAVPVLHQMRHAVTVQTVAVSVALMIAPVVMIQPCVATVHSAALKSVNAVTVASVLRTNPHWWMNPSAEC